MADDIFSALLSSGLGGGNMAATTAASPFYRGEVSHAGPMGQISQALMPIMQGATGHNDQMLSHLTDIIKLAVEVKKLKESGVLDDAKTRKILAEAGLAEGKHKLFNDMIDHLGGGTDMKLPKGSKLSVEGLTLSGEPMAEKTPNEIGLLQKAQAGDPEAQALLDTLLQRKKDVAMAGAEGRAAGTPPKPKKALTPTKIEDYSRAISGGKDLANVIHGFETNKVSVKDILETTATHGLLATPVLRDYYRFYNDVAKARFGSRDTKAQYDRLSKELPPPLGFAADPKGFVTTLKSAYSHHAEWLNRTLGAESKEYDVDSLQKDAQALGGLAEPVADKKKTSIVTKLKGAGSDKDKASLMNELYLYYQDQGLDTNASFEAVKKDMGQ